jgi:glycogen debranching enzyme
VKSITNYFSRASREGEKFRETFSIDQERHILNYKLEKKEEIELILDVRDSYKNSYPDYEIEEVEDKILITINVEGETFYLSVSGFERFKISDEYFVRKYELDQERKSPPFEKAVFKALKITGKNLFFSVSSSKKEVLNKTGDLDLLKIKSKKEPLDFIAAKTGLENLLVKEERIYAGYPWFFQFWKRDEAVSLGGLKIINEEAAKKVFWNLLKNKQDGIKEDNCIDGPGWIFKRAFLFLNDFDDKEEKKLASYLKKYIDFNKKDPLIKTEEKRTWMDSINRKGARIEVQALQLSMYKLGKLIDEKNSDNYRELEDMLKKKVREIFWNGEFLADGYYPEEDKIDRTIRPNIFLTYYIYPELLTKEEWVKCFRRALYVLWLDWGGLATIDRNNSKFYSTHTGEDSRSYHQGDSWYFVNNLAAVAMNRLDHGKFSYEINKIISASREDLMWKGTISNHSEISSAERQIAQGAVSQAWSFATYIEAMYEILKIDNYSWF